MTRVIRDPNNISGGVNFGSVSDIKNVTLNTDVNNLVIADLENFTLIRVATTGNYNITGLVPYDITVATWVLIFNVGGNSLQIQSNSGSSDPDNRFLLGATKTLQSDEGLALVYDPITLRWRSFGINI